MPNFLSKIKFKKILHYARTHKIVTGVVILILLVTGYYTVRAFRGGGSQPSYVPAVVQKGTVIATVEGTGQVSADHQIDLKSKVSGDVIYIGARTGQTVGAGAVIAELDARDARLALEGAELDLAKLTKAPDPDDLAKAEGDALTAITQTYIDLPVILSNINTLLSGTLNDEVARRAGLTVANDRTAAINSYGTANANYQANANAYKNLTISSDQAQITAALNTTYGLAKDLAQALKDTKTTYDAAQTNLSWPVVTTDSTNLNTWINTTNGHLTSLLSAQTALDKLVKGTDQLDIESQQLAVQQKENSYSDYFIRAPFAGQVAKLDIKKADSISSGEVVGTFITTQKIALISLNEVDVANVALGQKATLTFDAVPDLTLTGQVVEVDLVGTLDQGVVTYGVKIGFDTQDARIKSGMSANASIITAVKQDVLTVPASAVKSRNNQSYVQLFTSSTTPGTEQPVTVGLSNDTVAEIKSGLKEGDQVVARTISATAVAKPTSAPSIFGGNNRRP